MKEIRKESCLTLDNSTGVIAEDCHEILRKVGFSEADTDLWVEKIVGILDDYTACFGEGAKVEYTFRKRFRKMNILIVIPGEEFDPFRDGTGAQKRFFDQLFRVNGNVGGLGLAYKYVLKHNIISVSIPLEEKERKLKKDPVLWGVILGIACGLLCRQLPQPVGNFIIHEIASPLQTIILDLLSGVMGPVIFISLISSVIALESIDDLTSLGFKIIGRFLLIILFLIAVSILFSGLIYQNFGTGSTGFSLGLVFSMLFDVVPTNLIDPFLKNHTAQLVILGFLTGSGLLLLGDSVRELKRIIEQINKWVMSVMNIILLTMPAIPFLSLMITLGEGKGKELLSGWKFIVACYLIFTVSIAVKAVKTSIKTGIRIPKLWQIIKPVAGVSFSTGSTTAALKSVYVASDELGIKQSFSSFWIPMGTAMLSPKTAVYGIVGAFMAAKLANMPISVSFLVVLIIITLELSAASPGTTAACLAVLKSVGLPVDYVGLISTCRLLTDNYCSACAISYNMLEEYEIAHKLGEIEDKEGSSVE